MKVVFAPDSFKGSITAADAAMAFAAGWTSADPSAQAVLRPMADGGEGTIDAFAAAVAGAERMPVSVRDPAGRPRPTVWLLLPPTADAPNGTGVIDVASTSGIELLDELRPFDADSHGFGTAICAALDHGVSRLILGIGSSASTDGGHGMLTALGARFLDGRGAPVRPGARGLLDIRRVDLTALRAAPETLVLTDVTNPLTGERGATAAFGPQKGLVAPPDIDAVDAALVRLARLLKVDPTVPGAGAAGGVGGALALWGGVLASGAQEVARLGGLAEALRDADVVVTGEGCYDGQSRNSKVPSYVAQLGVAAGARATLAAGAITADADRTPFAATVSLTELAGSSDAALAAPAHWLRVAGQALATSARRATVTPTRSALTEPLALP